MNITRRFFLKSTGALAVYCGIAPAKVLAEAGLAASTAGKVRRGKTLVVIFLRGGMDGLNFVVPFADPAYQKLRRAIAVAAPGQPDGALDLDGFFGLHPRAASLMPLFKSGAAVAMQAVGYAHNTRSHFEEQDVWETGVTGNTIHSDGWLNRHLLTSDGWGPIRAVSIGETLPRILRGKAPAYAVRGLSELTMPGKPDESADVMAALEHAYCTKPPGEDAAARDLLGQTARVTLDGIEQMRSLIEHPYQPDAPYPKSSLSTRLQEVARLIKADLGLEVAEVDFGGWDTHNNQGGVTGQFGNLVATLSDAVAAFSADLGDRMNDVLLLTLSDFGRTAAENGAAGTDHGWANCMLAVGGPVAGSGARQVAGHWPGLAKEQLYQGRDLLHTTDFRDVIGEVVSTHLGNRDLQTILPGHTFKPAGLIG